MSQRAHERAAELHNLAAHAHAAAAVAHGKEDHLTAHELSRQAHEHSMNAHKITQELGQKTGQVQDADGATQKASWCGLIIRPSVTATFEPTTGSWVPWTSQRQCMNVRNIFDQTIRQEISMQIQVNTDHTIEGHEALDDRIRGVVENALSWMSDHITRVEVHLTDERGPKRGKNDKRCMMEARLEGRQPIAITDEASTLDLAVDGAADKLARLIEHTLGKLHDSKSVAPLRRSWLHAG